MRSCIQELHTKIHNKHLINLLLIMATGTIISVVVHYLLCPIAVGANFFYINVKFISLDYVLVDVLEVTQTEI